MIKIITFIPLFFLFACAAQKKVVDSTELPACLKAKIDSMTIDPNEGSPQSVTRYTYHLRTVYYMKAPCCDKFNIVFDSACTILGYPDGGLTGRGDGKMTDFFKDAKDARVIWKLNISR